MFQMLLNVVITVAVFVGVNCDIEYPEVGYCPAIKVCSTPLIYDVRYRCAVDRMCPAGYKCCRSACYIHRICVVAVNKNGDQITLATLTPASESYVTTDTQTTASQFNGKSEEMSLFTITPTSESHGTTGNNWGTTFLTQTASNQSNGKAEESSSTPEINSTTGNDWDTTFLTQTATNQANGKTEEISPSSENHSTTGNNWDTTFLTQTVTNQSNGKAEETRSTSESYSTTGTNWGTTFLTQTASNQSNGKAEESSSTAEINSTIGNDWDTTFLTQTVTDQSNGKAEETRSTSESHSTTGTDWGTTFLTQTATNQSNGKAEESSSTPEINSTTGNGWDTTFFTQTVTIQSNRISEDVSTTITEENTTSISLNGITTTNVNTETSDNRIDTTSSTSASGLTSLSTQTNPTESSVWSTTETLPITDSVTPTQATTKVTVTSRTETDVEGSGDRFTDDDEDILFTSRGVSTFTTNLHISTDDDNEKLEGSGSGVGEIDEIVFPDDYSFSTTFVIDKLHVSIGDLSPTDSDFGFETYTSGDINLEHTTEKSTSGDYLVITESTDLGGEAASTARGSTDEAHYSTLTEFFTASTSDDNITASIAVYNTDTINLDIVRESTTSETTKSEGSGGEFTDTEPGDVDEEITTIVSITIPDAIDTTNSTILKLNLTTIRTDPAVVTVTEDEDEEDDDYDDEVDEDIRSNFQRRIVAG